MAFNAWLACCVSLPLLIYLGNHAQFFFFFISYYKIKKIIIINILFFKKAYQESDTWIEAFHNITLLKNCEMEGKIKETLKGIFAKWLNKKIVIFKP